MGRNQKTNRGQGTGPKYWTKPKVPVGLKMDKDLIDRAKAEAEKRGIPFTQLVANGIEREIAMGKRA